MAGEDVAVTKPDAPVTIEEVAACLRAAAITARRLPPARVQGHFNCWPPIKRERWEILAGGEATYRPVPAGPQDVEKMVEAMHWMQWLELEQRHLVWMRAEGYRWRDIACRFGCNRTTAWRRWQSALQIVVHHLGAAIPYPKTLSHAG